MKRITSRLRALSPTVANVLVLSLISIAGLVGAYVRLSLDETQIAQLEQQFLIPGVKSAQGGVVANKNLLRDQQARIDALEARIRALEARLSAVAPAPTPSRATTPTTRPPSAPTSQPAAAPRPTPGGPTPAPRPTPAPSPSPTPCALVVICP